MVESIAIFFYFNTGKISVCFYGNRHTSTKWKFSDTGKRGEYMEQILEKAKVMGLVVHMRIGYLYLGTHVVPMCM
jgi:hypothetical protein